MAQSKLDVRPVLGGELRHSRMASLADARRHGRTRRWRPMTNVGTRAAMDILASHADRIADAGMRGTGA
ncbi:hypothetical protein [Methylobacterium sp. CM6247]